MKAISDATDVRSRSVKAREFAAMIMQFNDHPNCELVASAFNGDMAKLEQLISSGIDPNGKIVGGTTALTGAVVAGHSEIVKFLLEKGASPDVANAEGLTPLMLSAMFNDVEIAKLLLVAGADVDRKTSSHQTAFEIACANGHVEVARNLLWAGAKLHRSRKGRARPWGLWLAIKRGHSGIVELILAHDKAIFEEKMHLINYIGAAAELGRLEILDILLDRAGSNVTRDDYSRLLFASTNECQNASVQFLLQRGADANVEISGYRPLHIAAS